MSDTSADDLEAQKRRIKLMLERAEGEAKIGRTEAAEEHFAHAARLMEKYRITKEQVRAFRGDDEEGIDSFRYPLGTKAKYLRASLRLLNAVAQHYSVIVAIPKTGNSKEPLMAGTPSDIEATLMMFESLLLQRDHECLRSRIPAGTNKNSYYNSFCYGYAFTIFERLLAIREAARAAAAIDLDSTVGTALAVIDRRLERVQQAMTGQIAQKKVGQNSARLDGDGLLNGQAAGERADLGQRRMGGGPLAIGR